MSSELVRVLVVFFIEAKGIKSLSTRSNSLSCYLTLILSVLILSVLILYWVFRQDAFNDVLLFVGEIHPTSLYTRFIVQVIFMR